MVLAAGAGRRLRPDTDRIPKTLLPVTGDTTILDIGLRNLAAVGLTDVVVVVGYASEVVADRAADLEKRHGVRIELVHNDRAEEWNNAYSLWLAREYFRCGVLLVNGDTVHPVSVEKTLLAARDQAAAIPAGADPDDLGLDGLGLDDLDGLDDGPGHADMILAIDTAKTLADEEMKVVLDDRGLLRRITKQMHPGLAHGEYIGATLIQPAAAVPLAEALEATWRRDPGLYYEDGYQELADRGGNVAVAPIGDVEWVEVDDHRDLRRARDIAPRCLHG
jgi:choline kinase